MQEMWVQSLDREDSVVEDMVINHFSILVWETPWSMGLQRAGLEKATQQRLQTPYWTYTADTSADAQIHHAMSLNKAYHISIYLLHKRRGNLNYLRSLVPHPSYFQWCNHEPKAQKRKQLFRPGEGLLFWRREIKQEGRGLPSARSMVAKWTPRSVKTHYLNELHTSPLLWVHRQWTENFPHCACPWMTIITRQGLIWALHTY